MLDTVNPVLRNNPFKETVVWTAPAVGEEDPVETNVDGVFDDPYAEGQIGGMQVQSSEPAFHCAAASVPGIGEGHTITRGGTVYKVKEKQPDGQGMVKLILSED